jgi:glyoxylase-like metal-dependent hydrolase (beta-lactamase superfamily II)/rhodanese-related sulfurtransferase
MIKKLISITLLFLGLSLGAKVMDKAEFSALAQKSVTSIDTKAVQEILAKNPNTKLIDVRSKEDILSEGGFIKANHVLRIPRDKLEFLIGENVAPEEQFIVYGNTGNISLLATEQLQRMGYKNVLHYKGSYQAWNKAGLPTSSLDRYLDSMLYSHVQKVAEGVYTSIGQTSPGSYENSGHNNNLGFVIGSESVLVWNASSSYLLAKSLHEEIKKITDKPVKYVVLENSQGHAMLGSNYWQEQGAKVVSQELAKDEIKTLGEKILESSKRRLKDKQLGTKITTPDITFKDSMKFDLGGRIVEAKYFGYAHEQSDICLWLPKEKIVFGGDLAFNGRVLPIFPHTDTRKWIEASDKFAALGANIVIPGHGDVTDMPTVTKYTKGYIEFLREEVGKIIDDGGDLVDAYKIDQSKYEHLDTFQELAKRNVATLFGQMEFEE